MLLLFIVMSSNGLYDEACLPGFLLHLGKHVLECPAHLGHFVVLLGKKYRKKQWLILRVKDQAVFNSRCSTVSISIFFCRRPISCLSSVCMLSFCCMWRCSRSSIPWRESDTQTSSGHAVRDRFLFKGPHLTQSWLVGKALSCSIKQQSSLFVANR